MFEADDFARDPYGYATNQGSHMSVVGVTLGWLALYLLPAVWAPVAVALVYGVGWEVIKQRGRKWADSLEDTAHVAVGASVLAGCFYYLPPAAVWPAWVTVGLCLAAWLVVLFIGFFRRFRL